MMVDTKKEVFTIYFYGRIKEKGGRKKWGDQEEERTQIIARKKSLH